MIERRPLAPVLRAIAWTLLRDALRVALELD
jgi:hypothetical protein